MTDTLESSPGFEATLVPEESQTFRVARLLLLLAVAAVDKRRIRSLDRLAYFDFFADNPWVVVDGDERENHSDRETLMLAGFSATQLAYASTGPRFTSRRGRIRADLARAVALGLVDLASDEFVITEKGATTAGEMHSSYADAYRESARVVLRRLAALSNRALDAQAEQWLGHSWLLVDLLDDVRGAEVAASTVEGTTS